MTEENQNLEEQVVRKNMMVFDKHQFSKLVINDLNKDKNGRRFLKKYTQSEVREIIEGYRLEKNQEKLREISRLLFAKSPEYQRLIRHFSDMATFAHIITPIRDISKGSKSKVLKQYIEIGELARRMSLKHEMLKVLRNAFAEDVFYGYVFQDKKSFYIQKIDANICKITSIEDGVYNFSIDMLYFKKDERKLIGFSDEIKLKYMAWKKKYGETKVDPNIINWNYVELDPKNTICIKVNEEMLEIFPPFAGSFDAIFDIQAYKELRKNKEEIGNYMILTQELPIRKDSENNNDFMIDFDTMNFFHNMASDTVPENVGVITSPMPIQPVNFQRDTGEQDGVQKATRDYWSGNGTSQLLFNADTSTSQGLLMSIKTDEEIVFAVITQIQRWLNRYLSYQFNDLMFNIDILHVTEFNRQEMFDMYIQAGQYGLPVKSHLCATVGLDPIGTMNMAYLENDVLKLHEEFIPLISSNTMSVVLGADGKIQPQPTTPTASGSGASSQPKSPSANPKGGRPQADPKKQSDSTARGKDKPNGN